VRLQVERMAASGWRAVCEAKLPLSCFKVGGNWSKAKANRPRKSSGAVVWFNPNAQTAMFQIIKPVPTEKEMNDLG
jgi:hypothetical protein